VSCPYQRRNWRPRLAFVSAVVEIHLPMAESPADRYFELEDELTVALESADRGYVDGSDVGQGEFTIFLGGLDEHALLDSVRQLLPIDLTRSDHDRPGMGRAFTWARMQ
jgi:hypothetical protein